MRHAACYVNCATYGKEGKGIMGLRGRVERIDGKLTVRYEYTRYHSAERDTFWWAVSEHRSIQAWRLEGHAVVSNEHDEWRIAPEDDDFWQLRHCAAVVPKKEQAMKVETTPVLAPKVRAGIQTRWHNGAWEKLLKKGWVLA